MTKKIFVGNVPVGGGERVKIQSMTTVKTSDVPAVLKQINALANAGCDIVRVAVPDEAAARAVREIKAASPLPVVADIHFSARLAVLAIENGADKVRINPGNIGGEDKIALVADCVKAHRIPVRVGANTGSIEKGFLEKYGKNEFSLVESALYNVGILEKHGISDIAISVKASDVPLTVRAYKLLSQRCDYPLHLGVTEAGTKESGVVKSSIGIGALLLDGIGDTIRVSLSADPVEEIYAARRILRALVRAVRVGLHGARRKGGKEGVRREKEVQDRRDGLYRERPRRGCGRRYRHCGRERFLPDLPQRRARDKSSAGARGRRIYEASGRAFRKVTHDERGIFGTAAREGKFRARRAQ